MKRTLLKSKIHRATVTAADLSYEGSVTLDRDLMDAADLREFERVEIYNISSGTRLATYAIEGPRGSGVVCINGAAAHLVSPGDLVIVASYAEYSESELTESPQGHRPRIVRVDEDNRPVAGGLSSDSNGSGVASESNAAGHSLSGHLNEPLSAPLGPPRTR